MQRNMFYNSVLNIYYHHRYTKNFNKYFGFIHFLQNDPQLDPEYVYFHLDDTRPRAGSLSKRTKITFGEGLATRRIVVFNSLNRARVEPVRLRVAQYSIKVR